MGLPPEAVSVAVLLVHVVPPFVLTYAPPTELFVNATAVAKVPDGFEITTLAPTLDTVIDADTEPVIAYPAPAAVVR